MLNQHQRKIQAVWAKLSKVALQRSRQYLRALGDDPGNAEDLAQVALIEISVRFRTAHRNPKSLWQYGQASLATRFRVTNLKMAQTLQAHRPAQELLEPEILDDSVAQSGDLSEPEREALRGELARAFAWCLETITDQERAVIVGRFLTTPPLSLSEMGQKLDVTAERIRQIEGMALRKLRHPTRTRRLYEFTGLIHEKARREEPNIWTPLGRAMIEAIACGYRIEDYTDDEILSGRYRDSYHSFPLPRHSW